MALSDYIGGPQQYDPALGLMLVQNPELVALHLASRGHEPPEDITGNPSHVDAGNSLGRALQFAGGGFDQSTKGDYLPPGFQTPGLGFVGTMDNPAQLPPIIQPPDTQAPQDRPGPTNPATTATTPAPESTPTPGPTPPPPPTPPRIVVRKEVPSDGEDTSVPLPTPNPLRDASTTSGGDVGGKVGKGLDNLATSLAGLHALPYQNPLHIYTPQAPRPSNVISRSQVPSVLMQELAAAGRPASMFRLGEALRGKAYA